MPDSDEKVETALILPVTYNYTEVSVFKESGL